MFNFISSIHLCTFTSKISISIAFNSPVHCASPWSCQHSCMTSSSSQGFMSLWSLVCFLSYFQFHHIIFQVPIPVYFQTCTLMQHSFHDASVLQSKKKFVAECKKNVPIFYLYTQLILYDLNKRPNVPWPHSLNLL